MFQLCHHVAGVLSLDAVVPGEECNFQRGEPRGLDVQETVFQILPETGGCPVFDGKTGTFGDLIVFGAKETLELVAETKDVGPSVSALAQVVEFQAQRLANGEQPLEVGGAKPEESTVDRSLGADKIGVPLTFLGIVVPRAGAFSPEVLR